MQLLKITTTPIEYKLEVTHPTLKEVDPAEQRPAEQPKQPRGGDSFHASGAGTQGAGVQAYSPNRVNAPPPAETIPPQSSAGAASLDAAIAQIPSGQVDASWEPETALSEDAHPLAEAKREMEYNPGEVKIDIETMPKVDIEYIGDPTYFPKSANPDFKPDQA